MDSINPSQEGVKQSKDGKVLPDVFIKAALMVLLAGIVITNILIIQQSVTFNTLIDEVKNTKPMILNEDNYSFEATGIYVPDCGYFVDTRGRNIMDINTTEYHEACHALIEQADRGHFCG